MTFVSYAQNYEDLRLWRALGGVDRGRYLDVGAQDPVLDSVSKAFYDVGWRGIHVEPTAAYAAALRKDRPDELVVEAALGQPGTITFYEFPETGISTGVAEFARMHSEAGFTVRLQEVPVVPLSKIFAEFGAESIHWMKIDVEGMEGDVIQTWGQSSAKPWVLVIESVHPSTRAPIEDDWPDLVVGRGYKEVVFDGLNRYFVAEEHGDLAEAIAAPPNIFDDFTVLRHHFSVRGVAAEFDLTLAEIKESLVLAKEELNTGQLRIEELEATATALTTERERIDSDLAAEKAKVMDFAAELERVREMFAEQLAAERTDAAAVQAELEHRISSITEEMATAGQENHRKVAELEESLSETREALSASGQELDRVRASVEAHRSVALEADALIRRAAQSRRGRWHQFGEAIGLVRPQQVWRALSDWSLPDI